MLLRLVTFLLLAACAAADLATIQGVLDAVNAGLRNLDTLVLGLGNGTPPELLTQLGAQAIPLLQNATSVVAQSAPLTLQDALSLNTSTAALRQNTNLTIQDFVAKKPFFDAMGTTATVLQGLQADKIGSVAFAQAILSKIPSTTGQTTIPDGLTGLGNTLNDLSSIFDLGIASFMGATAATNVQNGTGVLNTDGSCNCAAVCPAGSLVMNGLTRRYT